MIIKEFFSTREDGVKLCRLYSDRGVCIKKIGTSEIYDAVIDIENAPFKYTETYIKVKSIEESSTLEETEIEDGDFELTEQEIATAFAEVF